jgi:predicted dehydrogenase
LKANGKLGFSLVGCGVIADVQAQAIQQSNKVDLVSVFSRNPDNAARIGEKYNVVWATDWSTFIDNDQIDVVSVCTPSGNHLDYGKMAAESGKNVVVEKPIEVTFDRANRLIEVCKTNGVKLSVIFQNRFVSNVQNLKDQLDAGAVGDIFLGDAYIKWYRKQSYYDSAAWRGTLYLDGGGALINQAIHSIDLLQWIMGEVESVYGQTGIFTHNGIEGEDTAAAVLRFKSGALGVIEGSTSVQPAMARRLEIHGTKGTAVLNNNSFTIQANENTNVIGKESSIPGGGAASPLQGYSLLPHQKQFESIVDAIKNDAQPPLSGQEALKSLAIVLAIYESAKTNQPVFLKEFMNTKISKNSKNSIV